MSKRPEVGAIVLAGGQAQRMDGQDKGLIQLDGRPLIAWVLERLAPQVDEIVISANRHLDEYAKLGHPVVTDVSADYRGPLAGIHAAGQTIQSEWLLVAPCDTPFLPHDLAQRLLDGTQAQNTRLACAADGEHVHAATLIMHRGLLDDLGERLTQNRLKVRDWQAENNCAVVRFSNAAQAFMNINTPDDLAAARRAIVRS